MIKNRINKIFSLTNIFLKDSYQNFNIINFKNKKLNIKSFLLWMVIIIFFAILFISQKITKFIVGNNLSELFLNFYFFILAILIILQTSLVIVNMFYFSKDIEYILPLPIKSTEILIAKFIAMMFRIYLFEIFFGFIPLTIYGVYSNSPILFYFYELIVFLIFPIFLAAAISIIMMFVMKISKFIKNKDLFQIIITFCLIAITIVIQYYALGIITNNNNFGEINNLSSTELSIKTNEIKDINNCFLVVNPSIKILSESKIISIIEVIKIIVIDFISLILFVFIGNKTYIKDVLINMNYIKNKKFKKNKIEKRHKKKAKFKTYIIKEFKTLYRNPFLFIQCIFPVIMLSITVSLLVIKLVPQFHIWLEDETFRNYIGDISFDITGVYVMLGIIQIIFMISPTSLIAISREGKKAYFMKYIPISLYKQFIYKGIPQILIDCIPILIILIVIHIMIPEILFKYILGTIVLSILLNIVNSYTMLTIDFINPKLNWDTEYEALKQNKNKIFQYVFTIGIILLFVYLSIVFKEINIEIAMILTGIIFILFITILNILVKFNCKKIYKKIF